MASLQRWRDLGGWMDRLIEGHKPVSGGGFSGQAGPVSLAGGGAVAGVAVYYLLGLAGAAGPDLGRGRETCLLRGMRAMWFRLPARMWTV